MTLPPDTLNDIGVLKRREIEARILMPLIEALGKEFGREKVLEIVRQTIITIAREQGAALAHHYGNGIDDFAESLANWKKGEALELDVIEQSDDKLCFNVTRCRFAEFFRALGEPELGSLLICQTDFDIASAGEGEVSLDRAQTIMQGAPRCTFRYKFAPR